jgi:FixJ family two-component response regulator
MTTPNPQFVAIVDDDANLCAAFAALLESAGLGAEMFPSAEDFLQRARPATIRCLVLDLGLPGMSGFDLLRHLRAGGWCTPIICITAQPDPDGQLATKILAAGAQTVLYKPFDSEELLNLLQFTDGRDKGTILGADG